MLECTHCGVAFPGRHRTDGKQKKFCTSRCFKLHRGILRECGSCGNEFTSYNENIYCSRACYEARRQQTHRVAYVCGICGAEFNRKLGTDSRPDRNADRPRYCSKGCSSRANSGEGNSRFRGVRRAYRGRTWRSQNQKIRTMFSDCKLCGTSIEGRRKHVDHIVPFVTARRGGNDPNGDRNLWVLCRNCHCRKTHMEYLLFAKGKDAYIKAIAASSTMTGIAEALDDAFVYCGISEVSGVHVVTRVRMKIRASEA